MKRVLMPGAAIAVAAIATVAIVDGNSSTPAQASGPPSAPVIHEPFKAMPCPEEAASTPDLEGCIEHKLLATDRQIDALDVEYFDSLSQIKLQRKFLAGHRAWLTYRRTDCADLWVTAEEGTIYPIVVGNCEIARNHQRIADLREVIAFPEKP